MLEVIAIPALKDNYIWAIVNREKGCCVAVDPGIASPVLSFLEEHELKLTSILITHHHWDHTGGIQALKEKYQPNILGPFYEHIKGVTHSIENKGIAELKFIGLRLTAIATPGHTDGQMAYYGEGMLFCGDTLFSAGCGRLFEGTPEQMFNSLRTLCGLPDSTKIYCGHEYTSNNLSFAALIEPENQAIKEYQDKVATLRRDNKPSLPSTIGLEKQVNPFLRCHLPEVKAAAEKYAGEELAEPVRVFAALRRWKDEF